MQRLIIVYNPRSSRFAEVKKDVLDTTRNLNGYIIGKYEVAPTDVDQNATKFAKLIKDGDLILAAGGDATASIAANGILKSAKDARLAVLPYGNFNDLSRTLGTKEIADVLSSNTKIGNLYPLDIMVDGKHWRYATCYVTLGMTAEAVHIYDEPKMRRRLKTNFGRKIFSYTELASWYLKNRHKKQFIPEFTLNSTKLPVGTSDYAAVNGSSMARVMKGGEDYRTPKIFRSETDCLTNLWRLIKLMTKSVFHRIPGSDTTGDVLEFTQPATVTLQAEGEHHTFNNIHKIEIKKGKQCLKVIQN